MLTELMEGAGPPRRVLRIDKLMPEWKPGETYTGSIKFTVLSMDMSGMTVDVTDVDLGEKYIEEEEDRAVPMQVVPSPS
jgi:hypothetical protein